MSRPLPASFNRPVFFIRRTAHRRRTCPGKTQVAPILLLSVFICRKTRSSCRIHLLRTYSGYPGKLRYLLDRGRKNHQGLGLGKELLRRTENLITERGGTLAYIETSSRKQYRPTHKFYESCGYRREAFLKNFYAKDDGKIIYAKVLK